MESDPSSAIILYPAPEGIVTISCPKCSFTRRVEAKSIKRASEGFSIRCRCGDIFKARVEFRKHYRKMVKLIGIFLNLRSGRQGQMVVEDLSIAGVGFRTSGRHDLLTGDSLEVTFNLDDRKNSKISLCVEVKRIQDQLVGTEIKQESRGSRDLGFYLMG
jgi:PilZ domain